MVRSAEASGVGRGVVWCQGAGHLAFSAQGLLSFPGFSIAAAVSGPTGGTGRRIGESWPARQADHIILAMRRGERTLDGDSAPPGDTVTLLPAPVSRITGADMLRRP